ncbi:MAG TPA: glutathione S-transferase family protein [Caulobacteraceae bacterium]|nr:glutathione S-transferase family protein [Caulobacteraceae bacterium]
MSDELVFYTHPMSRGRIIRWMLEETGQPYRTEVMDYVTTLKAPAYLAINPMGKIPAITHGGVVVTEAAAICAYLADAFPERGLAPAPGDKRRGTYFRWLFFAAGPVESVVITSALGVQVKPEQKRMVGWGDASDTLNALEGALKGKRHILGDVFSAADVYVGSQLGWGMQFGSIEKRPAFTAYVAGLEARPAFVRAKTIDDKLMAELTPAA